MASMTVGKPPKASLRSGVIGGAFSSCSGFTFSRLNASTFRSTIGLGTGISLALGFAEGALPFSHPFAWVSEGEPVFD